MEPLFTVNKYYGFGRWFVRELKLVDGIYSYYIQDRLDGAHDRWITERDLIKMLIH
jgi:hypothetical protein